MPKVSIILPTHNRAMTIKKSVESILEQTYKDFELIIIDDNSSDNTYGLVMAFGDNRIQYTKLEKQMGAAYARNVGLKKAAGDYLAFQDSDDIWLCEKLTKQMEVFEKEPDSTGVVYSGMWRINGDEKIFVPGGNIHRREGDIHTEVLRKNFIGLPSAIIRKECFATSGMFDESLPCLQDWELWIRMSKKYKFKYMNEALVDAYYTDESISINYKKLSAALMHILDKHYDVFRIHIKLLANRYIYLGHVLILAGDMSNGRKYFMQALKVYPVNLSSIFLFLLSLMGCAMYSAVLAKTHTR